MTSLRADWKATSYSTVGLELVVSVVFGLFGGRWLDQQFGSEPWLTYIGLGFGLAAGFRFVWRAAKRMRRDADTDGFREQQAGRDARYALEEQERDETKG